jgi:hypothetical protein
MKPSKSDEAPELFSTYTVGETSICLWLQSREEICLTSWGKQEKLAALKW